MIPGRGIALALTMLVIAILVIVPLSAIIVTMAGITPQGFIAIAFSPRALAAYRLSGLTALAASAFDVVVGVWLASVLVRERSVAGRILNALVDVPFAVPTAVTGITLVTLYGPHGWLGPVLARAGITVVFTPLGIGFALAFVGLPFIVRTVQPVIAALPREFTEAASSLGASRWTILRRITLPLLAPAMLTGFALALARTLGEYGSVIFIAGNVPFKTEIVPLIIVTRLEEYDYIGAAAVATVSLVASFLLLLAINALQRRLISQRVAE
ncbi:MAG: sulfate ABC transporter permease subunit CysT [Candidatus Velthaea sp.]